MSRIVSIALGVALLAPAQVWACAVCFGAKDDPQTQSLNMAILTLLGTTYALLGCMIALGIVLWRRSKKMITAELTPLSVDTREARHG